MANKSVKGYQGYNKSVLMKGLTAHVKKVIAPDLLDVLKRVADGIVKAIDSGYIPEYTGNLHDATGVAVYSDGALAYFRPTAKHATRPSKCGLNYTNHYGIVGSEFLQRTVSDAATTFSKGMWFVVMSTVPYAYYINENGSPLGRGKDFFNKTHEEALKEILAELRPIAESVTVTPGVSL